MKVKFLATLVGVMLFSTYSFSERVITTKKQNEYMLSLYEKTVKENIEFPESYKLIHNFSTEYIEDKRDISHFTLGIVCVVEYDKGKIKVVEDNRVWYPSSPEYKKIKELGE